MKEVRYQNYQWNGHQRLLNPQLLIRTTYHR